MRLLGQIARLDKRSQSSVGFCPFDIPIPTTDAHREQWVGRVLDRHKVGKHFEEEVSAV